jgi:8-oxo-dGTP pyrophosphatase MutT (NUDIX family)
MWLPPGGHIEQGELPDNAAVREILEETGLEVELVGKRREDVESPVQLHRPAGVQLENIEPGHQHIDLTYFARPTGSTEIAES